MQNAEVCRLLVNNLQTEKDFNPKSLNPKIRITSIQKCYPASGALSLGGHLIDTEDSTEKLDLEVAEDQIEQQTTVDGDRDHRRYQSQRKKLLSIFKRVVSSYDPDILRAALEEAISQAQYPQYQVVDSLQAASDMCGVPVDEILTPQGIEMQYQIDARKVRRWAATAGPDEKPYLSPLPIRLKPSGVGKPPQYLFLKKAVDNTIANPPKLGRRGNK